MQWHKYPDEKPKKDGTYYILIRRFIKNDFKDDLIELDWIGGKFRIYGEVSEIDIREWAEKEYA